MTEYEWVNRLVSARDKAGITNAEWSRRSTVKIDTIAKIVKHKVANPRGNTVPLLAEAVGVTPLWVKEGIGEGAERLMTIEGCFTGGQFVAAKDMQQQYSPAACPAELAADDGLFFFMMEDETLKNAPAYLPPGSVVISQRMDDYQGQVGPARTGGRARGSIVLIAHNEKPDVPVMIRQFHEDQQGNWLLVHRSDDPLAQSFLFSRALETGSDSVPAVDISRTHGIHSVVRRAWQYYS